MGAPSGVFTASEMTHTANDQYITILMQIKGDLGEVKGRLSALNELQDSHKAVEERVTALETGRTRDRGFIAGMALLAALLVQSLTYLKGIIGL